MKKYLLALAALSAVPTAANAADWIEKVSLTRDGIDAIQIQVAANHAGYTAIKSANHRFLLKLHAKATNGERIVAGKLGLGTGVSYFESSGGSWNRSFETGGANRTYSATHTPIIPMVQLGFYGADPKQACTNLMNQKMAKGMMKAQVLGKAWNTSVKVRFQFDAVAAHKGAASKGKWGIKNTTTERAGLIYDVGVKCLPGAAVKM